MINLPENDSVERVRARLHKANADKYNVNSWSFHNAKKVHINENVYLALDIPEAEADILKRNECCLRYMLGSVFVKFHEDHDSV